MIDLVPKMQVARLADSFLNSAKILIDNPPQDVGWVEPFLVNAALSLELYIKSYLAEDDSIPLFEFEDGGAIYQGFVKCRHKEHSLKKLYNLLDDSLREKFEAKFQSSSLAESFSSYSDVLEKYSCVFIEGRCSYEIQGFKGGRISDVLHAAIFFRECLYEFGQFVRTPG